MNFDALKVAAKPEFLFNKSDLDAAQINIYVRLNQHNKVGPNL